MADQGRWFKLWASAPTDPHLLALPPALRWAWAALGVYTKVHGTHGVLVTSGTNPALAAEMGVSSGELLSTIQRLPRISVEEGTSANGVVTVTWKNWQKYQEDSTVAERVRRWRLNQAKRDKRRREEKRGEGKKPSPISSPDEAFLQAIRNNPAYQHIDLDHELNRMRMWLLTPKGRGRKLTRGFVVSWLNKIDRPLGGKEDGWHPGKHVP